MSATHVIFDWNGTLLDDLGLAVSCVSRLAQSHLQRPVGAAEYRRDFGFPIRAFYARLGFATEGPAFDALMTAYLEEFDPGSLRCDLHPGAGDLLDGLQRAGLKLSILSASHQAALDQAVAHFGLAHHFDAVCGLSDQAAGGKLARGRDLAARLGGGAREIVYVGDTLHDAEVATALGWRAVLFSGGHQGRDVLAAAGHPIIDHLSELAPLVLVPRRPVLERL